MKPEISKEKFPKALVISLNKNNDFSVVIPPGAEQIAAALDINSEHPYASIGAANADAMKINERLIDALKN